MCKPTWTGNIPLRMKKCDGCDAPGETAARGYKSKLCFNCNVSNAKFSMVFNTSRIR